MIDVNRMNASIEMATLQRDLEEKKRSRTCGHDLDINCELCRPVLDLEFKLTAHQAVLFVRANESSVRPLA